MNFPDPVLLARIQFAFTISFHIIFPAFTIGLASFLAVLEGRWLKTGNDHFKDLYKFWVKIFAITFGMGVVSGVVMSYQFGTNWSVFADKTANVIGPLLGFEVLTAFFLEASFLGIMLFGWGRVSKKMHFFATCIVAIGTLISAFWILAANSWMQTPQGFSLDADGRFMPLNWLAIIFNPSFPYRFMHMVTAAYLTTAFAVGGVAAYFLLRKKQTEHARIMFIMAIALASLLAPLQIFLGDLHGLNTLHYQPVKISAMEGIWEHEASAGFRLFAIPDQKQEKNHFELKIPYASSLILTHSFHGEIKGLKEFPQENRPPVALVFLFFRIMIGIGLLMLALTFTSLIQYYRNRLYDSRFLQIAWLLMLPSGFIALLSGWFVTEIGRQPFTVYGMLRTAQSLSPAVLAPQVAWSLLAFIFLYSFIFGAGIYYIIKIIRKGIMATREDVQYYQQGLEATVARSLTTEGDNHV